jgi:hypothetical protein
MVKIIESTELLKGLTSFRIEIENEVGSRQSLQEIFDQYKSMVQASDVPPTHSDQHAVGAD